MPRVPRFFAILFSVIPALAFPQESNRETTSLDICLLEVLKNASPETTIAEVQATCKQLLTGHDISKAIKQTEFGDQDTGREIGSMELRDVVEEASMNTPFILSAHRANYILPAVYIEDPNNEPFDIFPDTGSLDNTEVQFQLSIKVPVTEGLLFQSDSLWVGYTMRAFWQAYNSDVSRPFRDTNHEPELLWQTQSELEWLGFKNIHNQIGINHQSNGQAGSFSRSWNRLIFSSSWEKGNLSMTATYWDRLNEDPATDENPRIETFVGNTQLMTSYAFNEKHRTTLMLRGNPEKGKGAAELTWSFNLPGSNKIKGMLKYFDGYGENLLDYDVRTRSFGIGFMVTDWY